LYDNPKNILQQKIKENLNKQTSHVVSDLIKLSLLKMAEKDEEMLIFAELFKLLGVEQFTETIALIDGQTITFPSKEEFKETITTVLCYYYRNVENKEWDEIKVLLGDPDLNNIKYGIRAASLGKFIDKMIGRAVQ
jgi:hypothetical protein